MWWGKVVTECPIYTLLGLERQMFFQYIFCLLSLIHVAQTSYNVRDRLTVCASSWVILFSHGPGVQRQNYK